MRVVVALVVFAGLLACSPSAERAPFQVGELLGQPSSEGFALALEPWPFAFPRDHGPHPDYRTEWWYFTGHLESESGEAFGYQLTFFRNALFAEAAPRPSEWATRDVYMAHFALTDVAGDRFFAAQRLSRGAAGLAGAEPGAFHVWLEDWSARAADDDPDLLRVRAAEPDFALDLELRSAKPPVFHGDRGLSPKGPRKGDASHYYTLSRITSRGTVRVGERVLAVRGESWLDREWSTSALAEDQVGWDWFAIQLDDDSELMLFRLRDRAGELAGFGGSYVPSDGPSVPLRAEDVRFEVAGRWRSPRTGAEYPSKWRIRLEEPALDLQLQPRIADQELDLIVRYWEGAHLVEGSKDGLPVVGLAYVELTGYGDPETGALQIRGAR